jgi:hypothetical protein
MGHEPIRQTTGASRPVLNPVCKRCGTRVPRYMLNNNDVCSECTTPDATLSLSRSVINRASMKDGWKKGEHRTGEL